MELVTEILKEDEKVLEKPAPRVVIDKFEPGYMNMLARFWVVRKNALTGRWGLNEKIKIKLDEAGIKMASPRMDISCETGSEGVPFSVRPGRGSREISGSFNMENWGTWDPDIYSPPH